MVIRANIYDTSAKTRLTAETNKIPARKKEKFFPGVWMIFDKISSVSKRFLDDLERV